MLLQLETLYKRVSKDLYFESRVVESSHRVESLNRIVESNHCVKS